MATRKPASRVAPHNPEAQPACPTDDCVGQRACPEPPAPPAPLPDGTVLTLRDGDVLHVTMDGDLRQAHADRLHELVRAHGFTDVLVLVTHPTVRLKRLDPELMRRAGWVRVQAAGDVHDVHRITAAER